MFLLSLVACNSCSRPLTDASTLDSGGPADTACALQEWCNGRDDDCDGEIDEGAIGIEQGWLDQDGDGWGDERVTSCDLPDHAVDVGGDCDDADPAVHPEAEDDERCAGEDPDCAPDLDCALAESALARLRGVEGTDIGGLGAALDGDVDGDGVPDLLVAGGSGLRLHVGTTLEGEVPLEEGLVFRGEGLVGRSVPDVDGDGRDELVVRASWEPAFWMIWGRDLPASGEGDLAALASYSLDDFRNVADVAVGADGRGEMLVFDGDDLLLVPGFDLASDATVRLTGFSTSDAWPGAATLADFDGDGLHDVAVQIDIKGYDSDYLFFGADGWTGGADADDARVVHHGSGWGDGLDVADVDGDGRDDLIQVEDFGADDHCVQVFTGLGATDPEAAIFLVVRDPDTIGSVAPRATDLTFVAGDTVWTVPYAGLSGTNEVGDVGTVILESEYTAPFFGLDIAGDLDGDGAPELVLDEWDWDDLGQVLVLPG